MTDEKVKTQTLSCGCVLRYTKTEEWLLPCLRHIECGYYKILDTKEAKNG